LSWRGKCLALWLLALGFELGVLAEVEPKANR